MKKFLLKSTFLIFCLYLPWITFIHTGRYYYAPDDYLAWNYKHDIIDRDSSKFNPKDIIIGDSLALAAVNPTLISTDLYNLAMSGFTLVDSYYFLKKYLESGKTPKRVFLSHGMTHWQGSDAFSGQTIGYGFLKTKDFNHFLESTSGLDFFYSPEESFSLFKKWFPFNYIYPYVVKNHKSTLAKVEYYLFKLGVAPLLFNHIKTIILDFYEYDQLKRKKEIIVRMESMKGQHFFDFNNTVNLPNPITNYDNWAIHPVNDLYFKKILALLKENKIQTIIEFVPNNYVTWKNFKPTFFKEMDSYFLDISYSYPNLIVSKSTSMPIENYGDMDHVNEIGQSVFSELFKAKYYKP
ncbi:MAG: hypothetical protein KC493_03865 [Bacteriovoracaceae bacterium]|nr:hypothetical protein [Bacteriovoracaceae bacterium]